jgi:acetyl esterase/lipase
LADSLSGGGFSLDGDDTHLKFWYGVQTELAANDISTAFLFVEYTLVPHATYPTQISEAVEAVNYVRTELQRPASDIILAGDSAGGNMALAVLSQTMHPSNDFPDLKLPEGEKLKALVLVAPWVSFRTDWPSADSNRYKDLVSTSAATMWSTDYLAGRETTPFAEAILAPADWWKDPKVEQILCVAGSEELLIDPISVWVDKYKVSRFLTCRFQQAN